MNLRIALYSLAVSFGVVAMTPLEALAAPTVSFKAPTNGATISGNIYQSSACEATGDRIDRVRFYLDSTALNTEENSPWNCNVDTTKFTNGAHALLAVAYDSKGASRKTKIGVNINNSTSTTTNTPPAVAFKTPLSGATVSGSLSGSACEASATDGDGVKQVQFYMDGTALNTELSSPYNCSVDTSKFADGAHTMKAVATDALGAASTAQIGITIKNGTTTSSTAPTVVWNAPAEGGTLTGNVQGPPNCVVTGTNIAKVMFYINDVWTNTDGNLDNGLGCWIDTTKYKDGAYTLKAVAYNAAGQASAPASRGIMIQNATSGTTGTGSVAIDAADIIGQALADVAFSQQAGYNGQVLGQYPYASSIPETGINGTVLSNGETVRLGKQTDPTNSTRNALTFQLDPSDPLTSGSKRTEIAYGKNIEMEKTYWVAFKVFVYDWGTLSSGDAGLFGTQLHSGDSSAGYSPSFAIYTSGSRNFKIQVRGTGLSGTLNYADQPLPFGRWIDFVFKVRQSTGSTGFLKAWMDGSQIVNHSGPIGYQTSYLDYFKFGYYNWSTAFNSTRKVLLRSPTIVLDPTGSKYDAATLRAYVNQ